MTPGAFQFAQPWAAWWLWLVAGAAVLMVVGLRRRRRLLELVAATPLLARLAPNLDLSRAWIRASLSTLTLAALTVALMDPRWGMQVEQVQRRGLDAIFVLDVSRSMLAGDATPSRLERAKQFVIDASEALEGDRVGLVDFAGSASLRVPLTLNYAAFRQAVQNLEPKAAARGGSMLGEAIRMAANSFPTADKGARAVIVLSDGEDMGSDPAKAAAEALEASGVRVYTVGIGDSRDGARVPLVGADGQRRYLVHDGQEVWSKMNPDTLREIAQAGGGAFIPAGTAQIDMAGVYRDSLAGLDRVDQESSLVKRQTPRFQWFAAAALVLLVAESLITDRRARREVA
ncbi:MAG: VWA domain-containing protein [Planctomycetes bacterium]|nr:VWA domain-containing protein [Planctomycetota bacterium]